MFKCTILLLLITHGFIQAADCGRYVNVALWEYGKVNEKNPWPPHQILRISVKEHTTFEDVQSELGKQMKKTVQIVGVGPKLGGKPTVPIKKKVKYDPWIVCNQSENESTIRAVYRPLIMKDNQSDEPLTNPTINT